MTDTGKTILTAAGLAGLLGGGLALYSALAARAAEKAVPPDGDFLDVPGARLHFTDRGAGPPVLLVHGLLGQMRNFGYGVAETLAREHRVIAVDRPGWGHSRLTGETRPGLVEQAEMIAALVRALGTERVLYVGHSMGGAVGLALALAHPELLRGLALIAPLTQPQPMIPPQFAALQTPPGLRELLAWTVAVPGGQLNGPAAAAAIFAPDPVPVDFATRGGGALTIRPKSYQMGSFELSVANGEVAAMVSRYPMLQVPTSILFGRGDKVLDPELNGRTTADAIVDAELTLIEGGHMLPVTHPGDVLAWLGQVQTRFGRG